MDTSAHLIFVYYPGHGLDRGARGSGSRGYIVFWFGGLGFDLSG